MPQKWPQTLWNWIEHKKDKTVQNSGHRFGLLLISVWDVPSTFYMLNCLEMEGFNFFLLNTACQNVKCLCGPSQAHSSHEINLV